MGNSLGHPMPRCRDCASSPTAVGGANAGAVVVGAGHRIPRESTTITVLANLTVGIVMPARPPTHRRQS